MKLYPTPTYRFSEVKSFIKLLELPEIELLKQLINDELHLYPLYESKAIFRLIALQEKALAINEVQVEFLLAYN